MSVSVYKIAVFSTNDCKYAIDRTEDWEEKFVQNFENQQDAENYIMQQTTQTNTSFQNLAYGLSGDDRLKFLKDFCFSDDKYLVHRRYFLGHVPKAAMKKALWEYNGTSMTISK